ncbi:YaaR family protein [Bacillus massiliglaciei]|uniref:YaaR family protein n=1 Tax=Bacillus massiliglaciei TaxID=1816693 RepID=UPI000DA63F76|nr:YaaR family protein [Bacillus massiliglaciei]
MEIQRVTTSSLPKMSNTEETAKSSVHFQSVMNTTRNNVTYERLSKKFAALETQGEKLADNQTVENLRKYKKMLKDFMDDALQNGLELQEQRGFNQRGSTKMYKLVKEADRKVVELTNQVLGQEKDGQSILSLVGEIKGIIINLYT